MGTMNTDAPPLPRMKVFRGHGETKQKIRAFEAAFRASLVAFAPRIAQPRGRGSARCRPAATSGRPSASTARLRAADPGSFGIAGFWLNGAGDEGPEPASRAALAPLNWIRSVFPSI
jgi:hypothetical protein